MCMLRGQEKHLTAEWIKKFEDVLKRAPVVMLDANLLPPAMEAACNCKFLTLMLSR
jgi:hypothetical protein